MSIAQELSEKIIHLVEKKPVCQNELVHILNVKHDQRISEAIKILLNNHKISRKKEKNTYLISLNGSHKSQPKILNFSALINNDIFMPCIGCECEGDTEKLRNCTKIMEWVTS